MSGRSFFIDKGIGETRGVVTLDGRPERLLIARAGEDPVGALGARSVARVRKVDRALGTASSNCPAARPRCCR